MKRVTFNGDLCDVDMTGRYPNGRQAIELTDAKTGELMLMATVNISEEPLANGYVIIKDYSENEGIFKVLIDAGIIEDTGRYVASGWVKCPVGKLL